jgi:hypothetical protein
MALPFLPPTYSGSGIRAKNFAHCYFPCKFKDLKSVDIIFISAKIELILGVALLAHGDF